MKKLTIFRSGVAEGIDDRLQRSSAYQVLAHSKQLAETAGYAPLIITSHVPRAVRTAKIIKMANPEAQISENAFLSHYYAGNPKRFIAGFAKGLPHYIQHVIIVSHGMNISDLTRGGHLKRGESLTIEAERWQDIFVAADRRYHVNSFQSDGKSPEEITAERCLSDQELEQLCSLPFLAD